MSASEARKAAIEGGFILQHWMMSRLDGLDLAGGFRYRMPILCFDLAIEHHRAITELQNKNINGSAMALVRPTFEAFIRGLWLRHCANDAQVKQFARDRLDPDFALCIEEKRMAPDE